MVLQVVDIASQAIEDAEGYPLSLGQHQEEGPPVSFPEAIPNPELPSAETDFADNALPQTAPVGAEPGYDEGSGQAWYPEDSSQGEGQGYNVHSGAVPSEPLPAEQEPTNQEFQPEEYITGVSVADTEYQPEEPYQTGRLQPGDLEAGRDAPYQEEPYQSQELTSEDAGLQDSVAPVSQESVTGTESEQPEELQPPAEIEPPDNTEDSEPTEGTAEDEQDRPESSGSADQVDGDYSREETPMETEDSDRQQMDVLDIIKDIDEFNRIADPGGAPERPSPQMVAFQEAERQEEPMEMERMQAEAVDAESEQRQEGVALAEPAGLGGDTPDEGYDDVDALGEQDPLAGAGEEEQQAILGGPADTGVLVESEQDAADKEEMEGLVGVDSVGDHDKGLTDGAGGEMAREDEEALLASPKGITETSGTEAAGEEPGTEVSEEPMPGRDDSQPGKDMENEAQSEMAGEVEEPGIIRDAESGDSQAMEASAVAQDDSQAEPVSKETATDDTPAEVQTKDEHEADKVGEEGQAEVKEDDGLEGLQITAVQGAVEIPSGEEKQEVGHIPQLSW